MENLKRLHKFSALASKGCRKECVNGNILGFTRATDYEYIYFAGYMIPTAIYRVPEGK